ncbi:ATP-binding cassette domain-containing protein [Eubacterium barkeri]|uniref:Phosphate ABC transporter ATP-binding protein, PhoT family n=1 Tax=Eubacterium barkeri TaxID=1528 RepID=A0A1H3AND1_EUBBA|nr:ABC transporter ATP-binding protein [Eubacterium barkeri]SDX30941.1 phosphate ABC transporter ATP-binding protein, PhoT family [Eubacterium barkeri]
MLKIKDFEIKYDETLFKKADLAVKQGEIAVVCGGSGSGKSSLLKAINGIISESHGVELKGDIEFEGQSILKKSISERSQFISTVFQNPKTQFFCINTTDELAFALENRNIPREEILKRIGHYTRLLHTAHLLDKNIFTLSGGEKQLVAITAAACMDNAIYLFDEPSASLDQASIVLLKNILLKLKKMGKIVIVAEHRLYYLREIMDHLVVLQDKKMAVLHTVGTTPSQWDRVSERYGLRTFKEISKADLKNLRYQRIHLTRGKNDVNGEEALVCQHFQAKYGRREVLDLCITFPAGINFIIGENGVGKTTFIKTLSRLKRRCGKSYYKKKRIKKSYAFMGQVMQDVNYQIFTESVWQEISIASSDDGVKKKVLAELDLYDKRDAHPQILSGGEKQRLLIGLAKVSDKPVIILDEPTSGLCKAKMMRIIQYLHHMQAQGKVILVITHDYEFIQKCGGRVYEFVREEAP